MNSKHKYIQRQYVFGKKLLIIFHLQTEEYETTDVEIIKSILRTKFGALFDLVGDHEPDFIWTLCELT